MDSLPLELIEYILSFLPDRDLVNFIIAEGFPPRMYFKFRDDHLLTSLLNLEKRLQCGLKTDLMLPNIVNVSKITIYSLKPLPDRFMHCRRSKYIDSIENINAKHVWIVNQPKITSEINFLYCVRSLKIYKQNYPLLPDLDLPTLQTLMIHKSHLRKLPKLKLPNLTLLDISCNELTEIVDLKLKKLVELHANDNQLNLISNVNLPLLKTLKIQNNQLQELDIGPTPYLKNIVTDEGVSIQQ